MRPLTKFATVLLTSLCLVTQADSTGSNNLFWNTATTHFWDISSVALAPTIAQEGLASWYGGSFLGKKTSSGQRLNASALTAANRDLPMGTLVEVFVPSTNRKIIVQINDRGPVSHRRIIDLSWAAAKTLGILRQGIANVQIRVVHRNELGPLIASSEPLSCTGNDYSPPETDTHTD